MAYASKQDLIDRFGTPELVDITDRTADHSNSAIDDTVLNKALADADAMIDSYLMGRYSLPLSSTPDRLKVACAHITRFLLYGRDVTDEVQKRFDIEIKWLEQVAMGKVGLGLDASDKTTPETGGVQYEAKDRVFGDDELVDF